MRPIFHIYKENIKTIFTNYAALLVILALCILPSLYAWFNIKASWDPYGQASTSGIKIGVVNLDTGVTLQDNEINMGNTVVDKLKQNKQLGWQFVDEKTARKAIEDGDYFAVVTIPSDFSANLTSILSSDVKKGKIIYTVNEKINAIAPKITDKGVTSLQSMISESLVQTVSEALFGIANQLGVDLKAEIPNLAKAQSLLTQIQGKFPDAEELVDNTQQGIEKLQELLDTANEGLPQVKEIIEGSTSLGGNIKTFLNDTRGIGEEVAPIIKKDLTVIQGVIDDVVATTDSVRDGIESGLENAPQIVSGLKEKVASVNSMAEGLLSVLETFNKLSGNGRLDQVISQLQAVSDDLTSMSSLLDQIETKLNQGETVDLSFLDNISEAGSSISSVINTVISAYDTTIEPELATIFDEANTVIDDVTQTLQGAEGTLPDVSQFIDIASISATQGEEGLAFIKEILPQAKALIDDLVNKMALINEDNGLQKLVNILELDAESHSEFLASPVEIQEEKLFPIANYGSAMAPFYTVLCLWVGILLLMSILSVEAEGDYKPYQVYFGKFLLFGTITLIQALVAALGDLYLLGIYCKNPFLFIVGNLLVAITFTAIVYSLVSVFGNIGKVVAIILLVLQVAGSGGTYPVQMTPVFFQRINPFLPFTYGISFAREAIGGVVQAVIWKDIIILLMYIAIAILLSVLLKKTVNHWLEGFFKEFKESKLGDS